MLEDFAKDRWILFARRVYPVVHDAIMDAARREGITPKHAHDTMTPQEAVHLFPNVCDYAIRRRFTIGERVRPVLSAPI